jgi:hypothetical protein
VLTYTEPSLVATADLGELGWVQRDRHVTVMGGVALVRFPLVYAHELQLIGDGSHRIRVGLRAQRILAGADREQAASRGGRQAGNERQLVVERAGRRQLRLRCGEGTGIVADLQVDLVRTEVRRAPGTTDEGAVDVVAQVDGVNDGASGHDDRHGRLVNLQLVTQRRRRIGVGLRALRVLASPDRERAVALPAADAAGQRKHIRELAA